MLFPDDRDPILWFNYKEDYGWLLVQAGVFPNVKAAWAANYRGSIPTGWLDATINGTRCYLYNPEEVRWADDRDQEGRFDPPWAEDENVMDFGTRDKWQRGS